MSNSANKVVVLIGPPNSGKTSLYNHLTGSRFKTVNYPGSLNSGDTGDGQNITLFQILVSHGSDRVRAHEDLAASDCPTLRGLFGPDVNHAGLALLIKVRQPRFMGVRLI